MKVLLLTFLVTVNVVISQNMPDCNPAIVEWFPHPYAGCTKYILCFHGNPIERLCAPGLHYSKFYEQCMLPQLAKCDVNYACPAEDDEWNPVFLPDANDCSKYFVCFEGSAIPRNCASGLWWDVVYNWCTFGDEVTCDYRVPNNPNPTPTPTPDPEITTSEPEITTQEPEITRTPEVTTPLVTTTQTTTTTQDPNSYDCPLNDEITLHPHSIYCHKYFICFKGVAYLRECAEGLIFDINERECALEDDATCIAGNSNVDNNESWEIPYIFRFDCPLQGNNEITFYPHEKKCERYYKCQQGIAYLRNCIPGEIFDVDSGKCDVKSDSVCIINY